MNNNRSVSAAIGEYLVLGELLKRNIEAYLAHGDTQKGWDLVIVTNESTKRVQVKSIDWPNQLAVNGNFAGGFDYLVVVLLDRINPRSRFFVFEHAELDALLSPPNQLRTEGETNPDNESEIDGLQVQTSRRQLESPAACAHGVKARSRPCNVRE